MRLPPPPADRTAVAAWVGDHLGHVCSDEVRPSPAFRGGQTAADAALERFDVGGYAARRNEVLPAPRRGASKLSPYIRHGLLPLRRVWDHVAGGPHRDVAKFRDELLWQEYARHWYATYGTATRRETRYAQAAPAEVRDPWPLEMACVATNIEELRGDGWVVNQARMWLASQWAVRADAPWREGEDAFFRHLLDGSRAANRLGWQWTAGLSKQSPYGFSRRQVERRAPGLCSECALESRCPIADWPDDPPRERIDRTGAPVSPDDVAGPIAPRVIAEPQLVWITAESLGDADPALRAHPELPVVFVFDEPLLVRLRLSSKRLVFLAECLADLATRREVEVWRGRPVNVLAGRGPAVTFAPVPGFRTIAPRVEPAVIHPWPWLRRPDGRSVASFSAWNRRR